MADLENGSEPAGEGLEEKAANVLNAAMIMLLAIVLAAFAGWSIFDFLTAVFSASPSVSWSEDGVLRFLTPLGLLLPALTMFRWGFGMLKSGSK